MKKLISIMSVLLTFILLLSSCDVLFPTTTTVQSCVVHQWSEYKYNERVHWREYTCGCPWPEIVEEHADIDEDFVCDICGADLKAASIYNESAVSLAGEKMNVSYNDSIDNGYLAFLAKLDIFAAKLSAKAYERFGEGKNVSFSPISVYMALALVCESADNETRQEVLNAIGVTYEEVNTYTKYLYAFCNQEHYVWNEENERELSGYGLLTNSIWLDDTVPFKNAGIDKLSKEYNCDVFQTDFGTDLAKEEIKSYINDKTRGLIDGNLPLDHETAFVLLNTFYLKDVWNDFGEDLDFTKEEYSFTNSDGSTAEKSFLMGYYQPGRAQSFDEYSVYYAETTNGYRLHFILPNGENAVDDVFTQANIENVLSISDWRAYEGDTVCHITRAIFPEFEAKFDESLKEMMLEDFDIITLFDETACDMSNVTDTSVFCSDMVHKSKLKIDKTGIEGAAVTAMIMAGESADPHIYEYHDFVVDKAFGFVLTDRYGTVLFSGVVNEID